MRWVWWWLKGGLVVMVAKVWVECGSSKEIRNGKERSVLTANYKNDGANFTDSIPSRCVIPGKN